MPGLAPGIEARIQSAQAAGETARLANAAAIHVAFGLSAITSRDNMARTAAKKIATSTSLLEAAKKVLRHAGHAGLSTREVAAGAGVPLSQIHYHFGSKQNLVLQLFEYLHGQLLDRQHQLFGDPSLKLSEQWDRACDCLDEDMGDDAQPPIDKVVDQRPPPSSLWRGHSNGFRRIDARDDRRRDHAGPFQAEPSKTRRSRWTRQSGRHDRGAALMPHGTPAHGWAS
jgi:AcrR family transcriptional regulator